MKDKFQFIPTNAMIKLPMLTALKREQDVLVIRGEKK